MCALRLIFFWFERVLRKNRWSAPLACVYVVLAAQPFSSGLVSDGGKTQGARSGQTAWHQIERVCACLCVCPLVCAGVHECPCVNGDLN